MPESLHSHVIWASCFHRRYVDTDRLAERIAGKSLAEIYEDDGEELFRQAETEVLHTLKSKKSLLVSCGGGNCREGRQSCAYA